MGKNAEYSIWGVRKSFLTQASTKPKIMRNKISLSNVQEYVSR